MDVSIPRIIATYKSNGLLFEERTATVVAGDAAAERDPFHEVFIEEEQLAAGEVSGKRDARHRQARNRRKKRMRNDASVCLGDGWNLSSLACVCHAIEGYKDT